MHLCYGECRARSACTYVQSDLALLSPFLYNQLFIKRQFLDWTKFKAFAENRLRVAEMKISVSYMIEIIMGKEKMLVTSIPFSFSMFSKAFCPMVVKTRDCLVKKF